ncbi:MAG: hypothetical protein LUQ09_08490 [Methanomassiliicoccales archaeon]|nr:hypothetical protein [Methanomassiliicoccales archaeon]
MHSVEPEYWEALVLGGVSLAMLNGLGKRCVRWTVRPLPAGDMRVKMGP